MINLFYQFWTVDFFLQKVITNIAKYLNFIIFQNWLMRCHRHWAGNKCDNYVPQWWVEFDDALNWLFANTLRDFYPICRKLIIAAPNCHKDYLFYFLGNFCVIKSLQIIDPTLVAFNRALEIIFGYAFQIIVMEQMPTLLSITGAGLVLFSVLAISLQDILIRYIPEKMKFLF